jgi:lysozyme family protein
MPTPRQELADAIDMFEGGYQDQWTDLINIVNGKMVGTMRGVSPPALAKHRGVPIESLTPEIMQTVTADEAADIGEDHYYYGTGLDRLAWGPATAALVDIGWGSGPRQAVLFAQRFAGAPDDGAIGPITIGAYNAAVAKQGWHAATDHILGQRIAFYDLIIQRHPAWEIYRKGWTRRANWFSPANAAWWGKWAGDLRAAA